ncbi:unnamed protein product [Echinostoma caproni]|uniref:CUB domain-containing protein n=1 Tax=Echinostoma caproni TaxID=27848 RepID=A0A183A1Q8_9TREM|nr:unnamed protein product [Echinostoma caproni]
MAIKHDVNDYLKISDSIYGNFTSPNYPGLYPADLTCHYMFIGTAEQRSSVRDDCAFSFSCCLSILALGEGKSSCNLVRRLRPNINSAGDRPLVCRVPALCIRMPCLTVCTARSAKPFGTGW